MKILDAILLLGVALPLLVAIIATADRVGAFRTDRFSTKGRKRLTLALLILVLVVTIVLPASAPGKPVDLSRVTFPGLLLIQELLVLFLAAWWLLSGHPPVRDYLALGSRDPVHDAGVGLVMGIAAWGLMVVTSGIIFMAARALGVPPDRTIPPLVVWIARLPIIQRVLLVLVAMTVEELFFRAFLQTRLGLVPASLLFLASHSGYGDPLVFVGLAAVTAVLALTFRRTGSVIAPMVAHGTFDAIQLLVILPAAARYLPAR